MARRLTGFTLIELLITLMLVTCVIGISIPLYTGLLERSREHILLSQLLRAIQLAHSEAIAREATVTLATNTEWQNGFYITEDKILYQFQTQAVTGVIHLRSFPNSPKALRFSPQDLSRAENGTFWYCRHNSKIPEWAITVSQSSRPRVFYPTKHTGLPC